MSSDCPICLETLIPSEEIYTLPCNNCKYNFCTTCATEFLRSSKDDYTEASDGSKQVKVHIACPQCRSKYPMDIGDILLLRNAHSLGLAICDANGKPYPDSELTATQLSSKRDFYHGSRKNNVELAHGLFVKVLAGKQKEELDAAMPIWQRLFEGVDETDKASGQSNPRNSTESNFCDATLFFGLDDCMGTDEQAFVTQFLTNGQEEKLAQAALILNGVLKLYTSGGQVNRGMAKLTLAQTQKAFELKEKTKKRFPLPNHMPGYVNVPVFKRTKTFLQFVDTDWDGKIVAGNAKSQKIFDRVYSEYELPKESRKVVAIKSVGGAAGRVGLRKADIVTHINDQEWEGTAKELGEEIHRLHEANSDSEFNMTVNANRETAKFLQLRCKLMKTSQLELF
jgi:hypothetical protein